MNTPLLIRADKFLMRPMAFVLNLLVRFAGWILRPGHDLNKDFHTVAVCKFKGMGSILQSGPLLLALRRRYPKARLVFITSSENKMLLEWTGWVDQVVVLDHSNFLKLLGTVVRAWITVLRLRPGLYLDLEIYSNFSVMCTALSMARNRVGFYLRSSAFKMGIYTHMMFYNTRIPLYRVYLQMAALTGYEPKGEWEEASEHLQDRTRALPWTQTMDGMGKPVAPYMVVNVNASDLRLERRWPKNYFEELLLRLVDEYPEYGFYLIGSGSERLYVQEVATNLAHERIINIAGKTSLRDLWALMAGASMVITNDTGPMHMALFLQKPTVCLFGPCSPLQVRTGPRTRILYQGIYCSPCVHEFETPPCGGDNACMKQLSVAAVMDAVRDLDKNPLRSLEQPEVMYSVGEKTLGLVQRV